MGAPVRVVVVRVGGGGRVRGREGGVWMRRVRERVREGRGRCMVVGFLFSEKGGMGIEERKKERKVECFEYRVVPSVFGRI